MNKETKRQLILTGILLCLLIGTLTLWYDNFKFHSYVNVVDYQYCYGISQEDFMVDGYQLYKKGHVQKFGGARLIALKEKLFLKGDVVTLTMNFAKQDESYKQKYVIKTDNEVCFFPEETIDHISEEDFSSISFSLNVQRKKKSVYNQEFKMDSQELIVYNGSNKDYSMQNVYMGSNWLKTGNFSSTIDGIAKTYPYMSIDYLCLKDQGNVDNIDDYERFVHLQGQTTDFLAGQGIQSAFYDGEGSLLEKKMICVISLSQEENDTQPFTFMLDLSGTMKG